MPLHYEYQSITMQLAICNLHFQWNFQLVMRKSENTVTYPAPQKEGNFKQEVFRRDNNITNLGMLLQQINQN